MANKPEDICVSFDTAKALHDAGIVVESLYSWYKFYNKSSTTPNVAFEHLDLTENPDINNDWYDDRPYLRIIAKHPAPTAGELIGLLPKTIDIAVGADGHSHNNVRYNIYRRYKTKGYIVSYMMDSHYAEDDNLCEALAKMLIWLKEAGYEQD